MAKKLFYADVKLINSIVRDENDNQISLTSEERLAVSGAVGGPATALNPVTTQAYVDQQINSTQAGMKWKAPVDTVVAVAPATPVEGDRYLNTTDDKLYTCAVDGDWGAGEVPEANWSVVAKDTDGTWTYDGDSGAWIRVDVNSLPYASTEIAGKVELAESGEVAAGKVVQSNDARLLKGYYSATLTGTGTIVVSHNLDATKLIIQAWKSDELIEIGMMKNVADPTNKLDISINGASGDVDIYIIALP